VPSQRVDKYANLDFGRLKEQFGRGIEEVIITKLSVSLKNAQLQPNRAV